MSLNPTLLKPIIDECGNVTNSEELRDFATKPEFNPYLTTVGLYDEFGRMLAVAGKCEFKSCRVHFKILIVRAHVPRKVRIPCKDSEVSSILIAASSSISLPGW